MSSRVRAFLAALALLYLGAMFRFDAHAGTTGILYIVNRWSGVVTVCIATQCQEVIPK